MSTNDIISQAMAALEAKVGDLDSVRNRKIIESRGLKQISDSSEIEAIIKQVLDNNPKQIEQYRAGQHKLLGYFVGQVMKATQGKANPQQVNELLKKQLDS